MLVVSGFAVVFHGFSTSLGAGFLLLSDGDCLSGLVAGGCGCPCLVMSDSELLLLFSLSDMFGG